METRDVDQTMKAWAVETDVLFFLERENSFSGSMRNLLQRAERYDDWPSFVEFTGIFGRPHYFAKRAASDLKEKGYIVMSVAGKEIKIEITEKGREEARDRHAALSQALSPRG